LTFTKKEKRKNKDEKIKKEKEEGEIYPFKLIHKKM